MLVHETENGRPTPQQDDPRNSLVSAPSIPATRPECVDVDGGRLALEVLTAARDRFGVRLMQDAMSEAMPHYWERRARMFDAARRRPGEHEGRSTPAERAERDARLAETAAACRERAELCRMYPDDVKALTDDVVADLVRGEL